ncbi:hypothetical protein [Amycolatopsis sp. H20-H5]|uniref:hypothetical protein n=1 Tax=Amycolatopsis sp. H20-H5 TaxID=3046309 RepID=UPI002DBB624F|nr:hypothetical protein [Amycolatopsis sp. H20-H5]MEC3977706.1 hypothetical protein [Amycolatopsis sp. H20-H5]
MSQLRKYPDDEEDDVLDPDLPTKLPTEVPSAPNRDLGPRGTKEVDDPPNTGEAVIEPPT